MGTRTWRCTIRRAPGARNSGPGLPWPSVADHILSKWGRYGATDAKQGLRGRYCKGGEGDGRRSPSHSTPTEEPVLVQNGGNERARCKTACVCSSPSSKLSRPTGPEHLSSPLHRVASLCRESRSSRSAASCRRRPPLDGLRRWSRRLFPARAPSSFLAEVALGYVP
jgi:hypothetical protein